MVFKSPKNILYMINDFYRRFIKKEGSEKHYVLVSRLMIIILMIGSLFITKYVLTTISGAWEFIINASAGLGAVLILRWFWWRINAWSEISAMIAPLIIYPVARYGFGLESPITLYPIVIGTTVVWLAATFLTSPTDNKVISDFYKKLSQQSLNKGSLDPESCKTILESNAVELQSLLKAAFKIREKFWGRSLRYMEESATSVRSSSALSVRADFNTSKSSIISGKYWWPSFQSVPDLTAMIIVFHR